MCKQEPKCALRENRKGNVQRDIFEGAGDLLRTKIPRGKGLAGFFHYVKNSHDEPGLPGSKYI